MATKDWDDATITTGDEIPATEWVDMAQNNIKVNNAKISYNSTASTKLGTIEENAEVNTINSDTSTDGVTGSDQILNVTSCTQAEYDAGTPVSTMLYIITDA